MFYKLRDNLRDSGFWKRLVSRLLYPFAAHAHNKAKKHFPLVEEIVARMMEEQAALEGSSCAQIDRAADPTAKALAALFFAGRAGGGSAAGARPDGLLCGALGVSDRCGGRFGG